MTITDFQNLLSAVASELQRKEEPGEVGRAEGARCIQMASLSEATREYLVSIFDAQERRAEDEKAIARLQEQVKRMETEAAAMKSENHYLEKKYTKWKGNCMSRQEAIQALVERHNACEKRYAETIAQHAARISDLENTIGRKDNELLRLLQKCKTLSQEVNQEKETIVKQKEDLDGKTKEAEDWKQLYMQRNGKRGRVDPSNPMPSMAEMLSEKDETIEELKDRLSECHSQLIACSCPRDGLALAQSAPAVTGTGRPNTIT